MKEMLSPLRLNELSYERGCQGHTVPAAGRPTACQPAPSRMELVTAAFMPCLVRATRGLLACRFLSLALSLDHGPI